MATRTLKGFKDVSATETGRERKGDLGEMMKMRKWNKDGEWESMETGYKNNTRRDRN